MSRRRLRIRPAMTSFQAIGQRTTDVFRPAFVFFIHIFLNWAVRPCGRPELHIYKEAQKSELV